ncbi:MAG: gliding motility-associated C-terminal domain-containing protein [Bacteroidota bacterium]
MKKIYFTGLLLVLLGISPLAWATHIVGGEFELTKLNQKDSYLLTLNLYFDLINGNPEAEDANIIATIFRKKDNQFVTDIVLPKIGSEEINYTNPVCTSAKVRTKLILYGQILTLEAPNYSDPGGYYVVWERCCRNGTITNILIPGSVGNTFYLEFPAVVRNGVQFINSSPSFSNPKGDYICLNDPFVFEFGAIDPDGDELRYSLVTPYAGYSSTTYPIPGNKGSSNYPLVKWAPSIDNAHIIPGPQPLRVDPTSGRLTVTANRSGLYVFSVMCEEYRNNVRIGVVRRDFQLMALDCPKNTAPSVKMREVGKSKFYSSKDTLVIKSDDKRCFDLLFADRDRQSNLNLSLRPVNFVNNGLVSLSPTFGVINGPTDTLRTKLCWTNCAETSDNKPLLFQVIALDQGCPAPKSDTLLVKILFEPKPNRKPTVSTNLPQNTATVLDTTSVRFMVIANDIDGDSITLEAIGRGFDLQAEGMQFTNGSAVGSIQTPFVWNPPCGAANQPSYTIDFIVKDKRCIQEHKDTITVQLYNLQKANRAPTIRTDLPDNTVDFYIGKTQADSLFPIPLGHAIVFDVIAEDLDSNAINLTGRGRGFDMAALGMQFNDKVGVARVVSPFSWEPDCGALQESDQAEYMVDFFAEDQTCSPNRFDTVSVKFIIHDLSTEYTFKPANVFTPNGDSKNDYFQIPNLPEDNCKDKFEHIEVYNRWGKLTFQSDSRDFRWAGNNYPTGSYYYLIKYTRYTYKGYVSLLK